MNLDSFWSDVLAGVLVAAAAGLVAAIVAWLITRPLEDRRAQRSRDEAAAEDFYRAYGGFFAAWKAWAAFKPDGDGGQRTPANEQWMALLNQVSEAEGALESFLVRLTLERKLSTVELTRLWCFRQGYKSLRYAVRDGHALGWRRSDAAGPEGLRQHGRFVTYQAFNRVAIDVASMLTEKPRDSARPSPQEAAEAVATATGTHAPPGSVGADVAAPDWVDPSARPASWQWVLVANGLPIHGG